MNSDAFAFLDLVATLFFIDGLKALSSPKTALRGNRSAMLGMGLAVGVTFFHPQVHQGIGSVIALSLGAFVGTGIALKIKMTAMPQLVALLHSFVGFAAVLVAIGTYELHPMTSALSLLEVGLGSAIGAITFSGSLIAFGKLQELLPSAPWVFPGQRQLHLIAGGVVLILCGVFAFYPHFFILLCMTLLALVLGCTLVLAIGGADMPVVVSLLNSYSGWAAAATGFMLGHPLLITTGALVGSSGAILSYIMCQAMNRSIVSVLLGGFGGEVASGSQDLAEQRRVQSAAVEDVAFLMENASQVIMIPGYGMAVAQAQHAVKELYQRLTEQGVVVKFAIHPVAGRMPGHMNVLLAESDIPYDCVFEMDEINAEFSRTDVVFVIGANDVVNPAAKNDKNSPLYGMPILEAYKSKHIFVSKRSMKAGYAGVDNALFYDPHCSLVFGDAKKTCEALVKALELK